MNELERSAYPSCSAQGTARVEKATAESECLHARLSCRPTSSAVGYHERRRVDAPAWARPRPGRARHAAAQSPAPSPSETAPSGGGRGRGAKGPLPHARRWAREAEPPENMHELLESNGPNLHELHKRAQHFEPRHP